MPRIPEGPAKPYRKSLTVPNQWAVIDGQTVRTYNLGFFDIFVGVEESPKAQAAYIDMVARTSKSASREHITFLKEYATWAASTGVLNNELIAKKGLVTAWHDALTLYIPTLGAPSTKNNHRISSIEHDITRLAKTGLSLPDLEWAPYPTGTAGLPPFTIAAVIGACDDPAVTVSGLRKLADTIERMPTLDVRSSMRRISKITETRYSRSPAELSDEIRRRLVCCIAEDAAYAQAHA